jgi:hypothetical protein
MHSGRGLLLDGSGALSVDGRHDRVVHLDDGSDELAAPAVLLRPDGHVVWAGADQAGLDVALGRWFGTSGRARRGAPVSR